MRPENPFPEFIIDEVSGIKVENIRYADFEMGVDAMLLALEPLIRKIAPSSKLIDILYSRE